MNSRRNKEVQGRFNLLTGEDTYSSQVAQNPLTSRRVLSWIPSDDGSIHRELSEPHYLDTVLSGFPVSLYNFNHNDGAGNILRFYFCAARTDFGSNTKTCNLYVQSSTAWVLVPEVGTLSEAPMFKTIGNNLHMVDGVINWLFDGNQWVIDGLRIPNITPAATAPPGQTVSISPPSGSAGPSLPTVVSQTGAGVAWSTPNNIKAVGTAAAYVALTSGGASLFLQASDYGFAIPTGATIAGIVVTVQRHTDSGVAVDSVVTLMKSGTPVGSNLASGAAWPLTPVTTTYGGAANLWGTTWSAADINNLGVRFGAQRNSGVLAKLYVNFIQVTVYYAPAGVQMAFGPLTIAAGTAGLTEDGNNIVTVTTTSSTVPAMQPGDTVVIAGAGVAGYNGTFVVRALGLAAGVFFFSYHNNTGGLAASGGGTATCTNVLVIVTSPPGYVAGEQVILSGVTLGTYNGTWTISSIVSSMSFIVRTNFTGAANSGNGTATPTTNTALLQEYFPAIDTTAAGTFSCLVERNYWYTNADETPGRAHESSTSGQNPVSSGAVTNKKIAVYQTPGLFSSNLGSPIVSVNPSSDSPGPALPSLQADRVGLFMYINGTPIGTIASVQSPTQVTLVNPAAATVIDGRAVICDTKCTNWHIYASEVDSSKVGQFLFSVPVTQNLSTTPVYDQSPFIVSSANSFLPIFRPVRNDPPPPSKILETHKYRLWRVRSTRPNFFDFTANEEVSSGSNGDPTQSVPGADVNTQSDLVNEVSFPDQSNKIRAALSHADALYQFSERQCFPLYGESIDDFALSQVTAFNVGIAGRFAGKSTPFGLAFMSYDRKVFLYPSSGIPTTADATSALIEIGKPKRNTFEQISPLMLDQIVAEFYFFGRRSWFIICVPVNGNFQTWIYDFNTHGWFQLQQGFSALAVFEISDGSLVLVGGGRDGIIYVIDDLSGTFSFAGTCPAAAYRPALIDFGDPESMRVFKYLELEFTSDALAKDITVTWWIDPSDVDNPGTGQVLRLVKVRGANRYRAWPSGGALCQRMLIDITAAASTNQGAIRGAKLVADKVRGLTT